MSVRHFVGIEADKLILDPELARQNLHIRIFVILCTAIFFWVKLLSKRFPRSVFPEELNPYINVNAFTTIPGHYW